MELGYIMFRVLLGHLVADYLLQNNWMALNKSHNWKICVLHCVIYSFCICLFLWKLSPLLFVLVFLTHYPIDRYSLGQKWLDLVKGRNVLEAAFIKEDDYKDGVDFRAIRVAFSALVYVVADNTLHFVLMWGVIVGLRYAGLF